MLLKFKKAHRKEVKNVNKVLTFQKINNAVSTCFCVTAHCSSCFLTITTINLTNDSEGLYKLHNKSHGHHHLRPSIFLKQHKPRGRCLSSYSKHATTIMPPSHFISFRPTTHSHSLSPCSPRFCPRALYSFHPLLQPNTSPPVPLLPPADLFICP